METRFEDLLGLIYDAGMEPSTWKQFLECFSDAMNSTGTMLFVHDFAVHSSTTTSSPDHSFVAHSRADEAFIESFQRHYSHVNVWLENAKLYGEGVPVISSLLYPDSDLPKTEFFNDWLKPQNYFYSTGGSILQRGDVSVRLTALRPRSSGPYTESEITLYHRLMPHLQRALRIHWRILQEQEARSLSETALDRMSQAVALFDDSGRVLFANRQAEAIFRDGSGPTAVNQRLTAARRQDADNIRESLRHACQGFGSSLRLADAGTGRQWVITFVPLPTSILALSHDAHVMALIAEPGKPTAGDLGDFAKLYRLTSAETRVLKQLLVQESTQEIADTLQISIKTLRTQLSALFAKTETKNQRDLVKFYLSHPMLGIMPLSK